MRSSNLADRAANLLDKDIYSLFVAHHHFIDFEKPVQPINVQCSSQDDLSIVDLLKESRCQRELFK